MTGRDNLPHFEDHHRTTPEWTLSDEFKIEFLPGTTPASFRPRPPRRLSTEEDRELRKQLYWLLKHGFIEPSTPPYAAPVFFVPKGTDGLRLRMVTDFRQVNAVTVRDHCPSPSMLEQLDFLAGKRWHTSIGLVGAYHHLPIRREGRHKAAILTQHGTYQYTVLPFGLTNACAAFNRLTQSLLGPLTPYSEFCRAFVDDIGVATDGTFEQHLECVERVLEVLKGANLYVNRDKTIIGRDSVPHLGHVVSRHGLHVHPDRVKAMQEWPEPQSFADVRTFVGHATYMSRFIPGFSALVRPLNAARSGNPGKGGKQPSFQDKWGDEQRAAFRNLRSAVTADRALRAPRYEEPFFVQYDASKVAVGSALLQKHQVDGKDMLLPVAYASRVLTKAETSWPIYDLEHAALIHATKAFRPYIRHQKWTAIGDHQPLSHLLTQKELGLRQLRHLDLLAENHFDLVYWPGEKMLFADPLSRPPGVAIPYDEIQPNFSRSPCNECKAHPCGHDTSGTIRRAREQTVQTAELHVGLTGVQLSTAAALDPASVVAAYSDDPHTRAVQAAFRDERPSHFKRRYRQDQQGQLWLRPMEGVSDIIEERLLLPGTAGKKGPSVALHPMLRLAMEACHDAKVSGHSGVHVTYHRLRQRFFARGMWRLTKQYIADCRTCKLNRRAAHPAYGLSNPLEPPGLIPGADLSTDFTFALPLSKCPTTGHQYDGIQVYVCRLSSRVRLLPCNESITAEGAATLYMTQVLPFFGVMRSLVSDRDPRFTARCFQEILAALQVKTRMSTPHHAATDGQSEQKIRWLKDTLRMFCADSQTGWVALLPYLELMMNNTATAGREGLSPMEIWQGFPLLLPADLLTPEPTARKGAIAQDRLKDQAVAARAAQDAIVVAQDISAFRTNKSRVSLNLTVGQWVLVHKAHITPPSERQQDESRYKLRPMWVGPFRVTERVGTNAVRLDIPRATFPRSHPVFNVAGVEPYTFAQDEQPPDEVEPTTDATGQTAWVVEKILRHRIQKTPAKWTRKWLVRWQGFNNSRETWEPIESFVTGTTTNSELDAFELERVGSPALARPSPIQPSYFPLSGAQSRSVPFTASDGWRVSATLGARDTVAAFIARHGIAIRQFENYNFEAFAAPFKPAARLDPKRAYRLEPPVQNSPSG